MSDLKKIMNLTFENLHSTPRLSHLDKMLGIGTIISSILVRYYFNKVNIELKEFNWFYLQIGLQNKVYWQYSAKVYINVSPMLSTSTFKFAIFTHHCNLQTKFYNRMYKSFARIHNLIISF